MSGITCWRRLRYWQTAGVWEQLNQTLLHELRKLDRIDWSRATIESGTVRAVGGGEKTGQSPTDRGKPGIKHHVLTDANGILLNAILTGASRHAVTQLLPLIYSAPSVSGNTGYLKKHPASIYAGRAYGSEHHRQELRHRGIEPQPCRTQHTSWK